MTNGEARSAMETNGYYVARGVFEADHVRDLELEFDRIVAQLARSGEDVNARWDSVAGDGADTVVVHTHHVQNYSATWLGALQHPPFLDLAEELLGPDVVLHHSKLFQKPPGHGSPFPMHQDWRYFPTDDDSMIAAIVHVSPATLETGCVRVFPGSHRLGRRESTSGRDEWDDQAEYRRFAAEYPIDASVAVEAEPGDVVFFSYFTVHGSGPNVAEVPRKTVLAQLYAGSDRLDPVSGHSVSGLVLRGRNLYATRESVA